MSIDLRPIEAEHILLALRQYHQRKCMVCSEIVKKLLPIAQSGEFLLYWDPEQIPKHSRFEEERGRVTWGLGPHRFVDRETVKIEVMRLFEGGDAVIDRNVIASRLGITYELAEDICDELQLPKG